MRLYWFTTYLYILSNMADAMATHYRVLTYGLQAEANPIVWAFMVVLGPIHGLLAAKSLTVFVVQLTHELHKISPKSAVVVHILGTILTFGAASTWALI